MIIYLSTLGNTLEYGGKVSCYSLTEHIKYNRGTLYDILDYGTWSKKCDITEIHIENKIYEFYENFIRDTGCKKIIRYPLNIKGHS